MSILKSGKDSNELNIAWKLLREKLHLYGDQDNVTWSFSLLQAKS